MRCRPLRRGRSSPRHYGLRRTDGSTHGSVPPSNLSTQQLRCFAVTAWGEDVCFDWQLRKPFTNWPAGSLWANRIRGRTIVNNPPPPPLFFFFFVSSSSSSSSQNLDFCGSTLIKRCCKSVTFLVYNLKQVLYKLFLDDYDDIKLIAYSIVWYSTNVLVETL